MRLLYLDIDTLRADHLGCTGYHRDTTPNIDQLAAGGIRFADVYASDVPCLPSRTALATGVFGIRNGVVNHGGAAADLRSQGRDRGFNSVFAAKAWATQFYAAGWRTASISSFPFRHSASWWNHGFMEAMNLMRGFGGERADEVLPGALDWLDRNGRHDDWFLHVHFWDPHTPWDAPADFGEPFADEPIPSWYSEEIRAAHWELPGAHSAQELTGFELDQWGWGSRFPRQTLAIPDMAAVKHMFDGYDTGVRYADAAVGTIVDRLDALGVLDETAILVSTDHGEGFGELGVYADHQAADEATCHIPAVLRWPGLAPRVVEGLLYHLDIGATVVDLAGIEVPVDHWDGRSVAAELRAGATSVGRDHLVVSQGAWSCQRSVRWGDHLYASTSHDAFHGWPDEMLFDVVADPHEQHDLVAERAAVVAEGRDLLASWTSDQLARSFSPVDPMEIVMAEGGPFHCRGELPAYLERLRATGRSVWADRLAERHSLAGV
jgi:arylsulfatase A-like enzyme